MNSPRSCAPAPEASSLSRPIEGPRPRFAAEASRVRPNRRRASPPRFLPAQMLGCCKPLCQRHLARAALERQRPPRTCGNVSRTAARLPGVTIGSTRQQRIAGRDGGRRGHGLACAARGSASMGAGGERASRRALVAAHVPAPQRRAVWRAVRCRPVAVSTGVPTEVSARLRTEVRTGCAGAPARARTRVQSVVPNPEDGEAGTGDAPGIVVPGTARVSIVGTMVGISGSTRNRVNSRYSRERLSTVRSGMVCPVSRHVAREPGDGQGRVASRRSAR